MKYSFSLLLTLLITAGLSAQIPDTLKYKSLPDGDLYLEIHYPPGMDTTTSPVPAAIFFFGGGWNGGTRNHFKPQADYLINRGMIAVLADYRTKKSHNASPFDCLKDAKSAVRWLRTRGPDLGVDTSRLAVGGGSAGGHLAAATSLISAYNDEADDLSVSSSADALLLFNPVVDNGPGGYGFERIGEEFPNFSPLHNIRKGAPPTLFLVGSKDHLIPVATAEYYRTVMEKVGSRCELSIYEGGKHGFFNPQNPEFFQQTMVEMDDFLVSLGFLPPPEE
ncbi:alpha/beta hydrolase [Neolewinella aurantiaca]|uniref:Alpha/beta hydrolase n=1 Tax=Neolewinella aurantiaca TaxID=2602767 RepID=A0A5C7FFH4_9BACT|nr:alpha/beta hydrolase [Neolewinella aurantiaca]TXF89018.1 alpha/beta hydrolase [Neolewinella aurantiaca]